MAKKPIRPQLVRIDDVAAEALAFNPFDDSGEMTVGSRYVYRNDGKPLIDKELFKSFMKAGKGEKWASRNVTGIMTGLSDDPERAKALIDDFFDNRFCYTIQDASDINTAPLSVRHGVHTNLSEDPLTMLYLSADTCDQFLGMFLANMTLFGQEDVDMVMDVVIQSYTEAGYLMALYEYLLSSRWTEGVFNERNYLRYSRAAKKLISELIGDSELSASDPSMLSGRIAGGYAFREVLSRLSAVGFDEDKGIEIAESRRGQLCLRALRATEDEFFVSVASPLGEEQERAYLKAAIDFGRPRLAS